MSNEIPLNLYIVFSILTLCLVVYSFWVKDNIQAIIFSFISMALSFILAMAILNNSVVMVLTSGSTYQYIPVTNTAIAYFWDFIALLMLSTTILYLLSEINMRLEPIEEEEIQ